MVVNDLIITMSERASERMMATIFLFPFLFFFFIPSFNISWLGIDNLSQLVTAFGLVGLRKLR